MTSPTRMKMTHTIASEKEARYSFSHDKKKVTTLPTPTMNKTIPIAHHMTFVSTDVHLHLRMLTTCWWAICVRK